MTVGINALCLDGKAIVLAADRMVTAAGLNLEFEHDRSKLLPLGGCVAATAGDAILAAEIAREADAAIHAAGRLADVDAVASLLLASYRTHRHLRLEEQLHQLGYTWEQFKNDGLRCLGATVHQNVVVLMQQFNVNVELLLAGFTSVGVGRIGYLHHPGAMRWLDPIGFSAIGSGAQQAQMALISARYSVKLGVPDAVFHVYRAKRNAEAAPGVGRETDMMVLEQGKGPRTLSGPALAELSTLFDRATGTVSLDMKKLTEAINAN